VSGITQGRLLRTPGDCVISDNILYEAAPAARTNPVRTRADWDAMRAAALADPGAFHGGIAARNMHWFVADIGANGAWLAQDDDGRWHGWDAATAVPVSPDLPADFTPWHNGFDGSAAPHWRAREAEEWTNQWVAEGRMSPAERPFALALLGSCEPVEFGEDGMTAREAARRLFSARPLAPVSQELAPQAASPAAGMDSDAADFFRRRFSGLSLDEIARRMTPAA